MTRGKAGFFLAALSLLACLARGICAAPRTHAVRPGETLGAIAREYRVSVDDLRKWNNITGDRILAGQELLVSAPAPAPAAWHVVQRGDTLGSIAARHRVTVAQLRAWNNLSGDLIRPGQRLALRVDDRFVTRRDYHTVRAGENLSVIAARYGTTVPRLRALNRLRSDLIRPGQRLLVRTRRVPRHVPPPPIEPEPIIAGEMVFHRVARGETLASLALRYGLEAELIRDVNLLAEGVELREGQILAIPGPDDFLETDTPPDEPGPVDSPGTGSPVAEPGEQP